MNVRYFEGLARHVLAAQPWVKTVRTFSEAGVGKPVGVAIQSTAGQTALIQFVRASPSIPVPGEWPEEWTEAGSPQVKAVDANPTSPKEWSSAVAAALTAAGHPDMETAESFEEWGRTKKEAGVRVAGRDGSEIFGTVLDRDR